MLITKTPYRISLFGGGSDFPAWLSENNGSVLAFAINKYSYLTSRVLPPFFNHKYRVAYSKIELAQSINQITHPAFREGIRLFGNGKFFELHHHGDLPARSGIGSSSAFAVGLIAALVSLNNKEVAIDDLIKLAINFEQKILNENVGSQDQITCAIGGINLINFKKNETWAIDKINPSPNYIEEISYRSILFYSGIPRNSSDISKGLVDNMHNNKKNILRLIDLASTGATIIKTEGDLDQFGEMLSESWRIKQEMNPRSTNQTISELFEHANKSGALGGKVLGAGGGGFCLFWVKAGQREDFISKFKSGVVVPFKIENSGTKIIYSGE
jgi:D-glycero-alpha-D-manno-heptose-7-phosphate kinase